MKRGGQAVFPTLALAASLLSGCTTASPAPTVPVKGSSSARARLVGRWEGEYRSADTGRSGTIVFEFSGSVGRGDVLMMPAGSKEPIRPAHPEKTGGAEDTLLTLQVLHIRLIETSEEALSGLLDTYVDPDCLCEIQTSFNGVIRGDRIEGSFTSRPVVPGGPEATGQWFVTRRSKP
jgi:hypothetical protein